MDIQPKIEQTVTEPYITTNGESLEYAAVKMLATLGVLLALLGVSYWMFRKMAQGKFRHFNNSKSIQIIERRALSPKTALYIVEVAGKKILIAESHLEIRKIEELPTS